MFRKKDRSGVNNSQKGSMSVRLTDTCSRLDIDQPERSGEKLQATCSLPGEKKRGRCGC